MRTRQRRIPSQKYDEKIEACEAYLKAHKRSWLKTSAKSFRARVYHFHRWMSVSKVDLNDVEAADLRAYWRYLTKRGVKEITAHKYQWTIKAYLKWLVATGRIRRNAVELEIEKPIRPWLMEHAREIREPHSNKVHRIYIGEFYDWIEHEQIPIEVLTPQHLQDYERHLRGSSPPRSVATRRLIMCRIRNHLRWLCNRGRVTTSPVELGLSKRRWPTYVGGAHLPLQAKRFLKLMAAHKRPQTILGYQTKLRQFYRFLHGRQLSLEKFTRLDFEEYLASMHRDGYAPQTRRHTICAVQAYLSWLYECELLPHDPEPIIRNFPRPKLPDLLPRNLQPEVDRLVQDRLEKKGTEAALALLLMRRTGIRIGDLTALLFDCLRADPDSNSFLKVPIGKLHNERLVPLDAATLAILNRVKALSLKNSSGRKPDLLVIRRDGKAVTKDDYHLVLYEIDEELRLNAGLSFGEESLVSHRLRHTFATTLLSAGMSIEGIKELLGHRSFEMSLRYARVTPQKLRNDYLKAIATVEGDVTPPELHPARTDLVLGSALDEILLRLRGKLLDGYSEKKQLAAMIRRTERLRTQLRELD